MEKLLPEAKVTIIVEGMEDNTVFVIPQASDVTYTVDPSYSLEDGEPAEKRFALSCYALYDIDSNQEVIKSTLTDTELEDLIIERARDILRKRWQDPMTKTVRTTFSD